MRASNETRILINFTILILVGCLVIACSEDDNTSTISPVSPADTSDEEPPPIIELVPANNVTLEVAGHSVQVDSSGSLIEGRLNHVGPYNYFGYLYVGGLWIGSEDYDPPKANIVWSGTYPKSNYVRKIESADTSGVYIIDRRTTDTSLVTWPVDQGYPVDAAGRPITMGDVMTWSLLTSDSLDEPVLSNPNTDIEVSQAVWGYDHPDLVTTLFLRYEIMNVGEQHLSSVRVGYYTDTDLDNSINSTGYDSLLAITYTYTPRDTGATHVAGFTFLEVNGVSDPASIVTSHRVMRKNSYYDADFGEIGFETSEQIMFALKGLSNSGQPMINPVTNTPTMFAFTGDPISETGWLDVVVDVRSLLNGPILSIAPGESATVTIVMAVSDGDNLDLALNNLKQKIAQIRSTSEWWLWSD